MIIVDAILIAKAGLAKVGVCYPQSTP